MKLPQSYPHTANISLLRVHVRAGQKAAGYEHHGAGWESFWPCTKLFVIALSKRSK